MKFIVLLIFIALIGCNQEEKQSSGLNENELYCVGDFGDWVFLEDLKPDDVCATRQNGKIKMIIHLDKIKSEMELHKNKFINSDDRFLNNRSPFLKDLVFKDSKGKYITAYINKDGEGFPAKFFDNGADYFKEGASRIVINDKIGFINKKGDIIVEPKFTFAFPFKNGFSKVCQECREVSHGEHTSIESDEWFFIDKRGVRYKEKPKDLKIPFDDDYNQEVFGDKWLDNDKNMRKKLSSLCKTEPKACLNYATALFEEKFVFNLGHYKFNIHSMSHFVSIDPDKEEQSEDGLLSKLKELSIRNKEVEILHALAFYILDRNNEAESILHKHCEKNDAKACFWQAWVSSHILDIKKSKALYEKACKLRLDEACNNAKILKVSETEN